MNARRSIFAMLVACLLMSSIPASAQAGSEMSERAPAQPRAEPRIPHRPATDEQSREALPFLRTELFFGTATPAAVVTDDEFKAFLDEVVTPLFPDGLTVFKGEGQFRGADQVIVKETSFLLILLYPFESQDQSSRSIDFIRSSYVRLHQQQSVLRVDDPFLVWARF